MDDLIVTSISPRHIAECIQFDDAQGKSQLLCILRGETSSFRISSQTSSNHKIRFIDEEFKKQLNTICHKAEQIAEQEQLKKLCSLLVTQLSEGRVIVETKHRDGKVVAITSTHLARHEKMAKYDNVELASKKFFKEIAQAFDANLQAVLAQTILFNKEQVKSEPHLDTLKKQQDRLIVVQKESKWSLASVFFGVVESICDIFKPTVTKIQEKFIAAAREEARLSHEHQVQERKKKKRLKAEDEKRDILKYEVKLSDIKHEAVKKEQI